MLLGWLLLILAMLMLLSRTPLGETGCLSHFLGTYPCHRHSTLALRPVKVSISSELYLDYFRLPAFLNAQASSFFIHPPFPTQSVRLPWLPTPHYAAPV